MQTKRSVLFVAILLALSTAFLIVPTHAEGETGTATIYIYTDAERKTPVELDSNGRYYVVPGTEYYFNLSEITEYGIGKDITIWAYRTNSSENIKIGQFKVDSNPFDAIFNWTIPEDWFEELVKMKYGTNLENYWLYARGEMWVDCIVGNGILYAYLDSARTTEAPQDEHGNYLVFPGVTYYFNLTKITEYKGQVEVWASYWSPPPFSKFTNIWVGSGDVESKSSIIKFDWTIPELPKGTTITFKYGTNLWLPGLTWRFAANAEKIICFPLPRQLFVVPEVFLGPLGALVALFSGFKVTTFLRRKKVVN